MAFTQLTNDLNIIQALDDEPNDVGGLSAAQLKAKFDEAVNIIKTYINSTLLTELASQNASTWLGVYPLDDIPTATTIHQAILGTIDIAKQAQAGTLAPNIIETAMIQDAAVTGPKIAAGAIDTANIVDDAITTAKLLDDCITTDKILDDAVTNDKLADDAVDTDQIVDKAVTGAKIDDLTITNANLGTGCVTSTKIGSGEVKSTNIDTGAVTLNKMASEAKVHKSTINISGTWSGSGPWTQTVTIAGATLTANTKVDLQVDATLAASMVNNACTALFITNSSGTLTLTAVTGKPAAQNNVQVVYYETV